MITPHSDIYIPMNSNEILPMCCVLPHNYFPVKSNEILPITYEIWGDSFQKHILKNGEMVGPSTSCIHNNTRHRDNDIGKKCTSSRWVLESFCNNLIHRDTYTCEGWVRRGTATANDRGAWSLSMWGVSVVGPCFEPMHCAQCI